MVKSKKNHFLIVKHSKISFWNYLIYYLNFLNLILSFPSLINIPIILNEEKSEFCNLWESPFSSTFYWKIWQIILHSSAQQNFSDKMVHKRDFLKKQSCVTNTRTRRVHLKNHWHSAQGSKRTMYYVSWIRLNLMK